MYIPEFWCGVAATIIFEIVAFVVFVIYLNFKNK